jgi:putative ABC transport system permease protein
VRNDGVVIEQAFAQALGVRPGDRVTLNGRSFRVAGIAVSAAVPPYPLVCNTGCNFDYRQPELSNASPGLVWLTPAAARSLAAPANPLTYILNLKLADPARASAFAHAYNAGHPGSLAPFLDSWQDIRSQDGLLMANEQQGMLVGSWLLGLLAIASMTVLVGGRMAEQTRRVGLLKAVGATPRLVAAVLLAENLLLAPISAAAGLTAGWLAAPLLTSPGAGLAGTAGSPSLTWSAAALVAAAALAVVAAATLVPAIRAARTATAVALADAGHPPRRKAALNSVSARLPVPLLLGLRLAARRPRRIVLSATSISVAVTGIVAVLSVHVHAAQQSGGVSGLVNPRVDRLNQVMLVITVMLVALAAVNAVLTTWATVLDTRHPSALARALGATQRQVTAGVSAAQVLPGLPAAMIGIPAGIGLYAALRHGGPTAVPSLWWLAAVVAGTVVVTAGLTAIPARIGARRPVADVLQSEAT